MSYLDQDVFKTSQLIKEVGEVSVHPKFKKVKIEDNRIKIDNVTDFINTMESLRFHMVEYLPYEVYDFVHNNQGFEILDVLDQFKDFHRMELFLLATTPQSRMMNQAARFGYIGLLKYFYQKFCIDTKHKFHGKDKDDLIWSEDTAMFAAKNGHINSLKWLYENKCPWSDGQEFICVYAAQNGRLECLKYAHKHECKLTRSVMLNAANHGQFETMKYLHENGCPWHKNTCDFAATKDCDVDVSYVEDEIDIPDPYFKHTIPEPQYFECFKYAYENGAPTNQYLDAFAIRTNDTRFVEYLYKNNFKFCNEVVEEACYYGNPAVVKFLLDRSFTWNDYDNACGDFHGYCVKTPESSLLECLKLLIEDSFKNSDRPNIDIQRGIDIADKAKLSRIIEYLNSLRDSHALMASC